MLNTAIKFPGVVLMALLMVEATAALSPSPQLDDKVARNTGKRIPAKVTPPDISKDKTIKYDYPIVYVRAPRTPTSNEGSWSSVRRLGHVPGSELMLLPPDGREEVLVPVEPNEAITDPYVSFDGEWVYYAKLYHAGGQKGSDIFKIHVASRKIVRLTNQELTPNTGAVEQAGISRREVLNLGPCPAPGGKVVFVSDRNGFRSASGPGERALQLFIMSDDGSNVETIGHFNLGSALHPVILADGRILFSTAETQGIRQAVPWGIWSIHPDGTDWSPVVSAYGGNAVNFHFYTQLSDGHIVFDHYYQNTVFGTYTKQPAQPPEGSPAFGPGELTDARNHLFLQPFNSYGVERVTRFHDGGDRPPGAGWGGVTHPSGAPDNHLLTVWGGSGGAREELFDSGIYLIKSGRPIDYPDEMVLIKNDPRYQEMWPRALVPYKRTYGVDEPRSLSVRNDGRFSRLLPAGSPFGLIGAPSLYKRESYPLGAVPQGQVTGAFKPINGFAPKDDPFRGLGGLYRLVDYWNFGLTGADAGLYGNDDIHAIRIVAQEARTANGAEHGTYLIHSSHGNERLRILGEFPVRHFNQGRQPLDPDGNPDTSFFAKIPADVAWTFQTLDKRGMVLNMSETWHQLRPGEVRNDCGGCHAHSQRPTPFERTAAARDDYPAWDLTGGRIPLITSKKHDESGRQWDTGDETGVRWEKGGVKSVEFYRDIRPILQRSCIACHTSKWEKPAGDLILDQDEPAAEGAPGAAARLARDVPGNFGHRPLIGRGTDKPHGLGWAYGVGQASRYVRIFQSRRSLLIWKVFGKRLDGFNNEDFAYETVPGDPKSLVYQGKPFEDTPKNRQFVNLGYTGAAMPPPEAVAGTYVGPDGRKIKVEPLTDEDRLAFVRWIDLGCPIDLTYDLARPEKAKRPGGFMVDDSRPTLALSSPQPGTNPPLTRLVVGMYDYYSGLDLDSFTVTADFPVDGTTGANLASKFKAKTHGVWELTLSNPITALPRGTLTVLVKDRQGNTARIDRTFSVGARPAPR